MGDDLPSDATSLLRPLTLAFAAVLVTIVLMVDLGVATSFFVDLRRATPGGDKTVHFVLMGTMALLLNLLWRARRIELGPWTPLRGSALVAVVVTLEEFSQLFISSRSFSVDDLAYNYLGIVVLGQAGVGLLWLRARRSRVSADGGDAAGR